MLHDETAEQADIVSDHLPATNAKGSESQVWEPGSAAGGSQTRSHPTAPIKVLLTDTNRWALSARLAIRFAGFGCEVSGLCPSPGHPMMKTRAVSRIFRYDSLRPVNSLAAAIEETEPDIVIPTCDRGVGHLHELYELAKSRGEAEGRIGALIERSLGRPESYPIVSSRCELLAIAREEGVRVPTTCRISTPEELDSWRAHAEFPWVLKADGTWGGGGVRIVRSEEEIGESFNQLTDIFRFTRALKRLLVNRDAFWLRPWWNRSYHSIIAQTYVPGRPSNCTVVCWEGRILGIICVEVVSSDGPTGPANVVRIVDSPDMKFAAERIASRLKLSGFFGLDFVLEEGSNLAYLIEMNPRTTPPCHLSLRNGRDLVGALWAQLSDQANIQERPTTESEIIVYFAQTTRTITGTSPGHFQDIPADEPELLKELLRPFPDRTLLFRAVQFLTLRRNGRPNFAKTPAR